MYRGFCQVLWRFFLFYIVRNPVFLLVTFEGDFDNNVSVCNYLFMYFYKKKSTHFTCCWCDASCTAGSHQNLSPFHDDSCWPQRTGWSRNSFLSNKHCMDEQMVPFRGKRKFKKYRPSKSRKRGFKILFLEITLRFVRAAFLLGGSGGSLEAPHSSTCCPPAPEPPQGRVDVSSRSSAIQSSASPLSAPPPASSSTMCPITSACSQRRQAWWLASRSALSLLLTTCLPSWTVSSLQMAMRPPS